MVDRALDGAAIRMTEDDDELGSGHLGRVFEAPEDVGIDEVAGNAHGKYVAKALIEHELGRYPAIHAAEHRGDGRLARGCELHLSLRIAMHRPARHKARITFLQAIERLLGRRGALRGLCVDGTQILCPYGGSACPHRSDSHEKTSPRRHACLLQLPSRIRPFSPMSA